VIRDRLRTTETRDGGKAAVWRLDGSAARILRVQLRDTAPGTIQFDQAAPPDLPAAREQLPQHADLWDLVRADRMAALFDAREADPHTSATTWSQR
jgi:hypothetical protein